MSEFQIRSMVGGDVDAVMAIAASLAESPHWPRAAYEAALDPAASPRRIALVAEVAGVVIGFAIASFVPPESELETIAVSPQFQRAKAGSALLGALVQELESRQISEIMLEVRESNQPAQAFYLRHSLVAHAKRRAYYADTGEDAVIMRAILPFAQK